MEKKRNIFQWYSDYKKIKNRNSILDKLYEFNFINSKQFNSLALPSFDYISSVISVDGLYEKEELLFLKKKILKKNKRNIALDVGGHIGNHSIFFSNLFKKVYAFEPNPYIFRYLKFNLENIKNAHCFNYGASNKNTTHNLQTLENNSGASKIVKKKNKKNYICKFRKLDNLKFLNKKIDLIKIDVEGHEVEALEGMIKIVKKNKPIILFENMSNLNQEKFINKLKISGYKYFYSLNRKKWKTNQSLNYFFRILLKIFEAILFGAPEYSLQTTKLKFHKSEAHFHIASFKKL